jgi:hypothetical protein
MRCVAFGIPKGYETTGYAHRGRLRYSSLVERLYVNRKQLVQIQLSL